MRRTCCGVRVKAIASGGGRHNVRLAIDPDTLIHIFRTVELVASIGNSVCGVPSCLAHLIELSRKFISLPKGSNSSPRPAALATAGESGVKIDRRPIDRVTCAVRSGPAPL